MAPRVNHRNSPPLRQAESLRLHRRRVDKQNVPGIGWLAGCTGISLHQVASLALIYSSGMTQISPSELRISLMHSNQPHDPSENLSGEHLLENWVRVQQPYTSPTNSTVGGLLKTSWGSGCFTSIPSHLLVAKVQLFQRLRFGRKATHGCMAPGLSSAAAVGWPGGGTDSWMDDRLGIKIMKIMTSLDHNVLLYRLYTCMRTIWSSEFECPLSKHSSSKAHLYSYYQHSLHVGRDNFLSRLLC